MQYFNKPIFLNSKSSPFKSKYLFIICNNVNDCLDIIVFIWNIQYRGIKVHPSFSKSVSIICIVSDYTQWRAKIAHQQKMFAMPFVVKSHLYSWTSISRSMNSKYSIKSMRFNFWNTFFEYVFEWFYSAYSYFAKMYLYIVGHST